MLLTTTVACNSLGHCHVQFRRARCRVRTMQVQRERTSISMTSAFTLSSSHQWHIIVGDFTIVRALAQLWHTCRTSIRLHKFLHVALLLTVPEMYEYTRAVLRQL